MTTSATGGYILPATSEGLPRHLTLNQFIQTILVGISGLPGTLVRPGWQPEPPKNPDIDVNWMAFNISASVPDANAFVGLNRAGIDISQRQESLEISCSFYGPEAFEIAGLVRDGFQIQQNLEAMRAAKMGFTSTTTSTHAPDLVNARWINRVNMSIILVRQVQRTYPILPILSAAGTVHTVLGSEEYLLNWQTPEET